MLPYVNKAITTKKALYKKDLYEIRNLAAYSKILKIAEIDSTTASTTANIGAAIASMITSIIMTGSVTYVQLAVNTTNYCSKFGLLLLTCY